MDKFELQQLRDLPIEQVAERLGMELVRHKSLCPFHADHHPSLSFNPHAPPPQRLQRSLPMARSSPQPRQQLSP